MLDYEVKIAQTLDEIASAQRLRFEVFNLERDANRTSTLQEGIDSDQFDKYCDHLIVVDKNTNCVVGAYRLLLGCRIDKNIGFHSEKIFNIKGIKESGFQLLELGRSCVHKDYRNRVVINLLWNGIADYVRENSVKYIFGCARLDTTDPDEVNEAFIFLSEKFSANDGFKVTPHKENIFKNLNKNIKIENPYMVFRKLSPLIKGYLNVGALICGEPAINKEFNSIVFFMLLNTDKIKDSYRHHFVNFRSK